MRDYTRRDVLKMGATTGAAMLLGCGPRLSGAASPQAGELITKAIPSSGERLPVVGVGARNYRLGEGWAPDTTQFRATLKVFHEMGGTVVDTSPNYGASEDIVGDLLADLAIRDGLFMATKVDREEQGAGVTRMQQSFERLHTDHVELMQVHNLRGWETQLPTLREMKQDGRIRYLGVTTSSARQYEQLEQIMLQEELDFVQLDYSADRRGAAERLLPLAADRGMGVLVNLPFGRGRPPMNPG